MPTMVSTLLPLRRRGIGCFPLKRVLSSRNNWPILQIADLRWASSPCQSRPHGNEITDGGRRKTAARNPILGADKIARFFIGLAGKNAVHDIRVEPAMINGAVGALLYLDGELDHTMSMAIDGERIAAIYIVRNPDKLRHLPATVRH